MTLQSQGSQRIAHRPHKQRDTGRALPVEEASNGNQAGKAKVRGGKDSTEGFNEPRPARWNEESTSKIPYIEASIWKKQTWEVEPSNHRKINKSQRFSK